MTISWGSSDNASETSDRLSIALVGAEKNGKSCTAVSAPGPVLILDFDKRKQAALNWAKLNGWKNVYGVTLSDPGCKNGAAQLPEALANCYDILAALENSLDLSQFNGLNAPKETMLETLIIDSLSSLARSTMQYELYSNSDLRSTVTIGRTQLYFPKGFPAWNAEISTIENLVLRCLALPVNNIAIFHEQMEETENSTLEKPLFTGKTSVFPNRYRRILRYFNDVWRLKLTPSTKNPNINVPMIYPLPNYAFDGCSSLITEPVVEPNISRMLELHRQKLAAIKTKSLPASQTGIEAFAETLLFGK